MKRFSKKEKKELKLSPLRRLRKDLWNQGTTLEEFLETCYNCDLNPLPMLRARGIDIKYNKDVSYCDISVSHDNDRVVLSYPSYGRYEEWTRFNNRFQELVNTAERKRIQKQNRPHRVVRK